MKYTKPLEAVIIKAIIVVIGWCQLRATVKPMNQSDGLSYGETKMTKAGYVYVLSNPSMPGLMKIGRSQYGGRKRARQIYSQGGTGVPAPFSMEFEIWADDCHECEADVHEELNEYRLSNRREFFTMPKELAIEAVMRVVGSRHGITSGMEESTLTDWDLMPSYGEQAEAHIKELFPSVPLQFILAAAVGNYLEHSSVIDAINKLRANRDLILAGKKKYVELVK